MRPATPRPSPPQVYLDNKGEERGDGAWGAAQDVFDGNWDSNWHHGFVWGVLSLIPDKEAQLGYYPVPDRPPDDVDPKAIVAQYVVSMGGRARSRGSL